MDSPHQMITLFSVFSPTHGGLCYQFRVPSGFPSPRKFAVCSKEKNGLFALRHSICSLRFFDCGNKYLFLLNAALSVPSSPQNPPSPSPQGSARPRKTFPTRSRTCGRSAARTLGGRTLSPVQMGRSRATVGERHIPAGLPQPSVQRPSVRVTLAAAVKPTSAF